VRDTERVPHYPGRAPIEAYGTAGFRFAGMSHQGSILALPAGIWAWPPRTAGEIDEASLDRAIAARADIDFLLIGTGRVHHSLRAALESRLRELGIRFDVMPTAAAASTYNILLSEDRRVAAALIPAD
jgi:uncharacterized protein